MRAIALPFIFLSFAACGDDTADETGEHLAVVSGMLADPATARASHDAGATAAEATARAGGDAAHVVGLGASILDTPPTLWSAIDRWERPDAMDDFYTDPSFTTGVAALVTSPSVEQYRRQAEWHDWGDLDAGAGRPRWYVLVRGRLRDPDGAQAAHDAAAAAIEPNANALGDVAHLLFTGRRDDRAFLALDVWTDPAPIAAFYTDPGFVQAASGLLDGAPTITVLHATNWHQWGSTGAPTVDGTWRITRFACDGQDQPIGEFRLDVRGAGGTFVQRFDPGCVATLDETYGYPAATEFAITPEAITCDPSSTCGSIFGASCLPLPPPTGFAWSLDGDTMAFTRTASGPGDLPCQPGSAVDFAMQREAL
jgi:hypothetical protein